jgi:hypothetical protein
VIPYAEIMAALPPTVSSALQEAFDRAPLSADTPKEEVIRLLTRAVSEVESMRIPLSVDAQRMVDLLLKYIPSSVSEMLFA